MKCLNGEDSIAWMVDHLPKGVEIQPGTRLPQLVAAGWDAVRAPYPSDSGRKVALARCVCALICSERGLLVYLLNLHIFPSCGHIPLLERFREAHGDSRPVDEYPGHVIASQESGDAMSLMVMSLMFFWDALVVSGTGGSVLYFSHDDYLDFLSADPMTMERFKKAIEAFSNSNAMDR